MKRLIVFLIGIAIGIWVLRPKFQSEPATAPASNTKAPSSGTPSTNRKPTTSETTKTEPDALIDIKGIGPVVLEKLTELGITTFAQLAKQDPDELAAKLDTRITGDRIRRERWIEQAKEKS